MSIRFINTTTEVEDFDNELRHIVTYYDDISNVNTPPVINDIIITLLTSEEYVFQLSDIEDNFSDVENHNFFKLQINSLPNRGFLFFNDKKISSNIIVTKSDIENGKLKYLPFSGGYGDLYDIFLIKVKDDGLPLRPYSNQARIIFNITAPNFEPTVSNNEVTINYNSSYIFNLSDFTLNYNDIEGDLFGYILITSINIPYGVLKFNENVISNIDLPLLVTEDDLNNNLLVYEDDGLNIEYKEVSLIFEIFDDN